MIEIYSFYSDYVDRHKIKDLPGWNLGKPMPLKYRSNTKDYILLNMPGPSWLNYDRIHIWMDEDGEWQLSSMGRGGPDFDLDTFAGTYADTLREDILPQLPIYFYHLFFAMAFGTGDKDHIMYDELTTLLSKFK